MKAAVFFGKHDLSVCERDIPSLGEKSVLVRVMACGVCGTDLHIYEGAAGAAECVPPTILGHEFSGVVERVGPGVTDFAPGDRVAVDPNGACGECVWCLEGKAHFCPNMTSTGTVTDGGFAEYCVVLEKQLQRLADGLSFEAGAMAEPVSCCLHGMDLTGVRAGEDVLIIGGGTIGQIMLRLCRLQGAARVAVLEPVAEKRALARESGAVLAVDAFAPDAEAKLQEAFPRLFHRVIECVGSVPTMEAALRLAGNGAAVMLFGLTAPDAVLPLKPFDVFRKELHITSSFINPYTIGRAVGLLNSGALQVDDLITDLVPLDDCPKVFTDPAYRKRGKVVVKP